MNHVQQALGLAASATFHRPASDEPGTGLEQLLAAGVAIYLGERRRTSRRAEWQDARRLVIPHAREGGL